MSKPPKAFRKEIFDKKTYNKEKFQYLVNNSDWGHFYGQLCAEGMFSIFTSIIENSLNKSIQKKKVLSETIRVYLQYTRNGFREKQNIYTDN